MSEYASVYSILDATIDVPATGRHAGATATLRTRVGALDGLNLSTDLTWEIVSDDPMGNLHAYDVALTIPVGGSSWLAITVEGATRSAPYIDFGARWRQRLTPSGRPTEVALRIAPTLILVDRWCGAVQLGVEVRRNRSRR